MLLPNSRPHSFVSPLSDCLPKVVAAAISRVCLSRAKENDEWVRSVAEALAAPLHGPPDDPNGLRSVLVVHVAIGRVEGDGEWHLESTASGTSGTPPVIGLADDEPRSLNVPRIAGVPINLQSVDGCIARRQVLPDNLWASHHPMRSARLRIGFEEFVRLSTRLDPRESSRRLIVQLDQLISNSWAESDLIAFLEAIGNHLVEAYMSQIVEPQSRHEALLRRISPVQRKIVQMLVEGKTEPDIATTLGRSRHTIHDHVKAIYGVLGIASRFELLEKWSGGIIAGESKDTLPLAKSA